MSHVVAEELIKTNLLEYGKYISLYRAFPDVRDGLKPVQRRILWSAFEMGLKPDRGSLKCAKIIGHVIGSYNPHGDSSAYEALVAIATPWTIKYPLIQSVGNYGSIKGHPPAAYRYTESGITELGYSHFLDKKYLHFIPNFDGKEKEPEVLSSLLPMVLVNGYSGISMGFSGSIPSHHILNVAKTTQAYVKDLFQQTLDNALQSAKNYLAKHTPNSPISTLEDQKSPIGGKKIKGNPTPEIDPPTPVPGVVDVEDGVPGNLEVSPNHVGEASKTEKSYFALMNGPQLENECYCLSGHEEISEIYRTGVGSLAYCCAYELDLKQSKVTITGLAPLVTYSTLSTAWADLVEKEMIELADFTDSRTNIQVVMKDPRLFSTRILPALIKRESYQFHVVVPSSIKPLGKGASNEEHFEIKMCSLVDILSYWTQHRLSLWDLRITDLVTTYEQESLELDTQIKIIQNHAKFLKALASETLELVKKELAKFIVPKMVDYALSLKVSQILKLNEEVLKGKYKEAQDKFTYWNQTSAIFELNKQVDELVEFYQAADLPRTTTYCDKSALPQFKKLESKSNWIVVTDKGWELSQDQPIRGRGFTGKLVGECKDYFSFVDSGGYMEAVSVYAPGKRLGYEREQQECLLVVPDRDQVIVGLGSDGTLVCRLHDGGPNGRRAFSRVGLKTAVCVEPTDKLVVQFDNGRILMHTYEELLKKSTARVAVGWKDRLLGHKVGIKTIYRAHKGFLYVGGKVTDIKQRARLDGPVLSLGASNFCVNPSGQRLVLGFDLIPEGLEFVCPL